MKMKNKASVLAILILLALPVPFSLITVLGSVISLANMGTVTLSTAIPLIAMALSGTYTFTYAFSAIKTVSSKKIGFPVFLPLIHIALTILFIALWIMI
jgi:hypothetical protein